MIRAIVLAVVLGAALTGGAAAQSPEPAQETPPTVSSEAPATVDACLKKLEGLVNQALTLQLADDQIDKAEAAMSTMEQSCLDQRFDEANATAGSIQQMLTQGTGSDGATEGK